MTELFRARIRRRFQRGLKRKPLALIKRLRKAKKEAPPLEKPEVSLGIHCMIVRVVSKCNITSFTCYSVLIVSNYFHIIPFFIFISDSGIRNETLQSRLCLVLQYMDTYFCGSHHSLLFIEILSLPEIFLL